MSIAMLLWSIVSGPSAYAQSPGINFVAGYAPAYDDTNRVGFGGPRFEIEAVVRFKQVAALGVFYGDIIAPGTTYVHYSMLGLVARATVPKYLVSLSFKIDPVGLLLGFLSTYQASKFVSGMAIGIGYTFSIFSGLTVTPEIGFRIFRAPNPYFYGLGVPATQNLAFDASVVIGLF